MPTPSPRPIWLLVIFVVMTIIIASKNYHPAPPPQPTAEEKAAQDKQRAAQRLAQMEQYAAVAKAIRAQGYDCQTVDAMTRDLTFSYESYSVYCNHMRWHFTVENHGGRWSLKPD